MRITKVNIPAKEVFDDGLGYIKMDKLGHVVLIAGENGSGKTRLLHKIKTCLSKKPNLTALRSATQTIETYKKSIETSEKNREKVSSQIGGISDLGTELKRQIEQIERQIIEFKKVIKIQENILNWSLIETSEQSEQYRVIDYVPKSLDLLDCNKLPKQQLTNEANRIKELGITNLERCVFAAIQQLQDRYWHATHQKSTISESETDTIIESYERLEEYIKIFLNADLTRSADGDAKLFGFRLGETKLSDGQKVLLQFCTLIHAQETRLSDLILFMDEPENHLHPSVLIEVIDKIQESVTNGQIWIATHSIPLLAHFDPSSIWYMEDGKISYAGKETDKVLKGLLGDEEEISRLADFISLPAQFAMNKFAYQCLFSPLTVSTGKDDPQTNQINVIIKKLREDRKNIRVLDYGAGKGRLAATIYDLEEENGQDTIKDWLEYIAFDRDTKDKDLCENAIQRIYGDSTTRYFCDETALLSTLDKHSFDIVVMCNVFHEIDPNDWFNLFSAEGLILQMLKNEGVLLMVEDQLIPVGEKAYQKGFLVLDTLQLKRLFKIKEEDSLFKIFDARGDGRLKAHLIPKQYLTRIDKESRVEAIRMIEKQTVEQITAIRSREASFNNGRLHSFWSQQLVNSKFALKELSE